MSHTFRKVGFHVFTILFSLIMLYPIVWTISSSLKPNYEIFRNVTNLIPSPVEWSNYAIGWAGIGGIGFLRYFENSGFITSLVVVGSVISSSIVAFGFARLKFPFKKTLFICLIVTMMLPQQVTLIPQYILFRDIGWLNSFYPLIVPSFFGGTPFFVFLLMQFIRGIPRELDEAAIIDGCTTYGIFWRMILPLCKPALVTVAIFSFYWSWDNFFGPLIYLNSSKLYTVALGLAMFADPQANSEWGPMFAMSTLSLLPVFIVFLFFQKFIIKGVATTGLKG